MKLTELETKLLHALQVYTRETAIETLVHRARIRRRNNKKKK